MPLHDTVNGLLQNLNHGSELLWIDPLSTVCENMSTYSSEMNQVQNILAGIDTENLYFHRSWLEDQIIQNKPNFQSVSV